ncbi:MAG: amine oxidase [Ktedonobacterales bacterium]|nr:MAG: amine oxidase [Ktedonobacterales bacterium]
MVEARDRLGGRIWTMRPDAGATGMWPMELGAEFVHGRPPDILGIAQAASLTLAELAGTNWISTGGQLSRGATGDDVEAEEAGESEENDTTWETVMGWQGEDATLQEVFATQFADVRWAAAREQIARYVQGYDAADPAKVSVRWLAQTEAAAAAIDGSRQYRVVDGYDRVLTWLYAGVAPERTVLALNTLAHTLRWTPGAVTVEVRSRDGKELEPFTARAVVVTAPLGVLTAPADQLGALRFLPELPQGHLAACAKLAMGQTVKVILRFREPFWDPWQPAQLGGSAPETPILPRLSFLLSDDAVLPTWWTSDPLLTPTLTGWAGGPPTEHLVRQADADIADQAMEALARVLDVRRADLDRRLEQWHLHNWSTDPFARGAYSYVRAGGMDAPQQLGTAVAGTVFFAGEATNADGHTGTVHGALATGRRAADEVLAAIG